MSESFHVFLSHNSKDKPTVRQLAQALQARGLKVWLDEEQLVPGRPWQEALEAVIQTIRTAAVLVGKDGLGPWQDPEMRACLSEFVNRHLPVIPVLLPGAPVKPELPLFLRRAFTWVDLRDGLTDDGLDRLITGIRGRRFWERFDPLKKEVQFLYYWLTIIASAFAIIGAITGVIIGGVQLYLSFRHPIHSSPSTVPQIIPPATEARLKVYEAAYEAAAKIQEAGRRCEMLGAAFNRLSDEDKKLGQDSSSSEKWIASLIEGRICSEDISKSDDHFRAVDRAVRVAEASPTPKAVGDAADAFNALDAFDRSSSSQEKPQIAEAREFAEAWDASNTRIATVMREAAYFERDRSPDAYVRLHDAVSQITDFDHSRLNDAQKSTLARVDDAVQRVIKSRAHILHLSPLVTKAEQERSTSALQQLIAALVTITAFDEAVSIPEQKSVLKHAQSIAIPLAWTLLQQRLEALSHDDSSANYHAVADIYQILKNAPPEGRTEEQQRLLEQAEKVAGILADSDPRLQQLLDAASRLQKQGASTDDSIFDILHVITSFDRRRFEQRHQEAWDMLSRYEAIVRGPEHGLTKATPIFVSPTETPNPELRVGSRLHEKLLKAGYNVLENRYSVDAAVKVEVTIQVVGDPSCYSPGFGILCNATVRADIRAYWTVNGKDIFSGPVVKTEKRKSIDEAKDAATDTTIDAIVGSFQNQTEK